MFNLKSIGMNHSKLSILFVAYLAKTNRKGLCPLKCRLTYKKKRREFSSGLMVNSEQWNSKLQKVENDALFNSNIEIIRSKLQKAYISLELEMDNFTVHDIARKYLNKPEEHQT